MNVYASGTDCREMRELGSESESISEQVRTTVVSTERCVHRP